MIDKAVARKALEGLTADLKARAGALKEMPSTGEGAPRLDRHTDALLAEVHQWLALLLPAESPVLALFRERTAPAGNVEPASAQDRVDVALDAVAAARRWNETRIEADSLSALSDDVDRVVERKFFASKIVQFGLLALGAAVAFAVTGVIQFQGMRIDVKADIQQKQAELDKRVGEMNAQFAATASKAGQLDKEVEAARQRIADLAMSSMRELTAQKAAAVEAAAASAVAAVGHAGDAAVRRVEASVDVPGLQATRSEALATIGKAAAVADVAAAKVDALARVHAAANTEPLAAEIVLAQSTIKAAALRAVEEAKGRVAPTFDTAVKNDAARLNDMAEQIVKLQSQLAQSDSRTHVLEAAWRRLASDDRMVSRLAAYFDETVEAVAWVLGACIVLLMINLALLWAAMRQRRRLKAA